MKGLRVSCNLGEGCASAVVLSGSMWGQTEGARGLQWTEERFQGLVYSYTEM